MLSNASSLSCLLIGSQLFNTTSRYWDGIFSAFNFLSDPLVNYFLLLFINLSHILRQLLSYYWYDSL